MPFGQRFSSAIRRSFLSGLLVMVPLILSYLVLKLLFDTIDNILRPAFVHFFKIDIPGLGVVATLLLVFLIGMLTRNYVGGKLVQLGEQILTRVPLIRPVYSGAKQLLEATTGTSKTSFKEVALVEYPRRESWALCFVTQYISVETESGLRRCVAIFLPSTPTPLTGWAMVVPVEDVTLLDMTVEDGIKFVVSGGVVTPDRLRRKGPVVWKQSGGENA